MRRRENFVGNEGGGDGDDDETEYMQWFNSMITVPKLHRDTSLEADIMNAQAAILQFDEVASTLSLEDVNPEEREAIEEAVMAMSNALRVGDWYETPTTSETQTERGTN